MESAALKLGGAVASYGARSWLQRRRARFERGASLAELAEAQLKSPLQRRKLENLVERIGHQVAEQLAPVLGHRFGSLPDNEVDAAILAVIDVLREADLSDEALLAADADEEQLARRLRARFPERAREVSLSSRASELYELAFDQSCRHLVQVIRHLPSFQPAALAEVLARLSAQSDQLGALLARTPVTSLHAQRGTDHDADFRAEYLRHLSSTLDRLELLGIPAVEQPMLALTVAYLSLSVSEEPQRGRAARGPGRARFENWFDRLDAPRQAEGVPVEAAIGNARRTLLRGEAGSGKTTLLNWLAVRAARGELGGALADWNGCVPFPIRLRSFAAGELPAPEEFVAHSAKTVAGLMPENWVHRQLRAGAGLLLVDGVDEVPAHRRRAVKTWLRELLAGFPQTRVVVTARTAAADHRWLAGEGFESVTLEPMSPNNVLAFVERWHEAAEAVGAGVDVAAAHRRLRGQLERPHLRELATSPLLCAMLCALNLAHRSELPRDRMDLYAKAMAMLLHLRDAERGIAGHLGDAEKRVLLRDLAWRLTLANRIELSRADTLEHLTRKLSAMPNVDAEPGMLLAHLLERSGVLRAPVPGLVDFVHRTFQEYLAADEAIQQHHVDTLVGHAHLDTWWETIVMACGHATARQAGQLLTGILDRAEGEPTRARRLRLLAAACLETVRDVDSGVHARTDAVIERHLVPPRNLRETGSLAAVGHRVLRYLPGDLAELSDAKAAATVRAAALTASVDALPLLARYARDRRAVVQYELEKAWQYFDPERFAEEVLADAPLRDGEFEVRTRRLLPYVARLRALTSLSVELPSSERVEDLRLLDDAPALTELSVFCDPLRDLSLAPLREHRELKRAWLLGARRFTGLHTLASLAAMTSLALRQQQPILDLEFLTYSPRLTWLSLDNILAPDLAMIGGLSALEHLGLFRYMDRALARLAPFARVTSVEMFDPVDDGRTSTVAEKFPHATYMNLTGFEDADLDPLVTLPLGMLVLQRFSCLDLRPLSRLPNLRQLTLLRPARPVDLNPLADLSLRLTLTRGADYTGLDRLGPGVKVSYTD